LNAAREKVEQEGQCRVCGCPADLCDAAHLWDRSLGGVGFDDADLCIPLCSRIKGGTGCHDAYDAHQLDLRPYVTVAEAVAVVRAARSIERARNRLAGVDPGPAPAPAYGPFGG
jgi:hypothetical protein